jgi:hypothetical protein
MPPGKMNRCLAYILRVAPLHNEARGSESRSPLLARNAARASIFEPGLRAPNEHAIRNGRGSC